jgi:hypothetical protein
LFGVKNKGVVQWATPPGASDPAPTTRLVATIVAPLQCVGGELVRLDRSVDEPVPDLLAAGADRHPVQRRGRGEHARRGQPAERHEQRSHPGVVVVVADGIGEFVDDPVDLEFGTYATRWAGSHFLRRHVRIDRQLISPSGPGPVVFGPPKTASSNRVITLPTSVGEVLAAHIERFGTGPDGLVFTSATGASPRRSVWGKAYRSATAAVGIDSSTQDLRHHCASVLISSGVSIKSVQRFLGHKNASETLDTYGHLMPGDDDRLRAAIDVALRANVRGMCAVPSEAGTA